MRTSNLYAPSAYDGVADGSPQGYQDVDFGYVHDAVLTALLRRVDQIPIHNDSDFAWRGIVINVATGPFTVRFSDSQWYFLSSGPILSANLQGDASSPYVIFPELVIPAGGRVDVELTDTSGAPNTIQLLLRGVKRYRVGVSTAQV